MSQGFVKFNSKLLGTQNMSKELYTKEGTITFKIPPLLLVLGANGMLYSYEIYN